MADLRLLCVGMSDTTLIAMQRIQHSGAGIALVIDGEGRLLGTLSDGDLRTLILAGVDLHTNVGEVLATLAKLRGRARGPPVTASTSASRAELLVLMAEHGIRQVPLVDDSGRVVGLALQSELVVTDPLPLTAVVMAGGRGSRLAPLTDTTPKPMLPVGGRPLLERTLETLSAAGVRDVRIATHYLADSFERHFGDGHRHGVTLNYIKEHQPLGTAGALALMAPPHGSFLVMNGDILTDLDVRALVDFHHAERAELTICVRSLELSVPYGVVEGEGADVKRLIEKPRYSLFVNAGIYLLEPSVLALIPREQRLDMTELISALLERGRRVVSFPVHEYWLDIGQPADYARAVEDVDRGVVR